MSEWKECKLGTLCSLEYGKSLEGYTSSNGQYPVYGTNGRIGNSDTFLSPIPSVVIGRKGAYRGVHYSKCPFNVIDTAFYVKPKSDNIDLLFLYNFLLTQDINSRDSGSAIPSTDRYEIYDIDIPLPPLSEQRAIAGVLSSLDDKIDLLQRQNKTLEGMAEALWRKMFVEEADPGWKKGRLGDLGNIKHGFAFSGEYITDQETNRILVTPGNFYIGGGFKEDKFKYYTTDKYPIEYVLCDNDLIITMTDLSKDGDTLGYPAIIPLIKTKTFLHNQRIGRVIFKNDYNKIFKLFLYYLLKTEEYRAYILGNSSGTSIIHTAPERIRNYQINIPIETKIFQFNEYATPLFSKISTNKIQIRNLVHLRTELLPKLISGETKVNEVQREWSN